MGGGATIAAARHGREQEGSVHGVAAREKEEAALGRREEEEAGCRVAGRPSELAGRVGRERLGGLGRPVGQGRGRGRPSGPRRVAGPQGRPGRKQGKRISELKLDF